MELIYNISLNLPDTNGNMLNVQIVSQTHFKL